MKSVIGRNLNGDSINTLASSSSQKSVGAARRKNPRAVRL